MAFEILMPQLGLTMEEGTVAKWVKHEGDEVKAGDIILEITTDKLVNEIQSEHDGVLLKITAAEGEDVPVKGVLGYIGQKGESIGGGAEQAEQKQAAGADVREAAEAPAPKAAVCEANAQTGARIRISPLAKKTAAKLGVDYSSIAGSGSSGRITQKDIYIFAAKDRPAARPAAPAAPAAVSAHGASLMDGDTVEKQGSMRRVVAQRMSQSHTEVPPVTQVTKVDVTELMALRKALLAQSGKKYSVNDMVLAATAKMLRRHPEMLVSFDGDQVIRRAHVNLGMAVALDAGLIVPVIRDADTLGLDGVAAAAKDLAVRAKENKLTADEYKGSTFTVSNLGMFGIETFTPIVNQPDAAILGVCAIADELALDEGGNVVKRQAMRICLTYDHRLVDGAVAAKFSADLRDMLQAPLTILL